MKAVLDTCVLYPPILREILIAVAMDNGFAPVWSDEILEEWRQIAGRDGDENIMLVASEIARLTAHFPTAQTRVSQDDMADLYLPDINDLHVLAAARKKAAPLIVTANLRDFPRRELTHLGIQALHPDAFLRELWQHQPDLVEQAVRKVLSQARAMTSGAIEAKHLLKRARLPRLAKALAH